MLADTHAEQQGISFAEPLAMRSVEHARPPVPLAATRRTVWLVLDETSAAQGIEAALRAHGWCVTAAAHTLAGFRALLGLMPAPDVIVAGLKFDDGDGLQLIRALAPAARFSALYLATRERPETIASAVSLAAACGVSVVGFADPIEAAGIASEIDRGSTPSAKGNIGPAARGRVVPSESVGA